MTDTTHQDWTKLLEFLEPKPPIYCPHTPFKKQKVFLRYDGLEALYGGRAGGGKALALDTLIPTPGGYYTIGAIEPGDFVYDETGQSVEVLAVSEVMHDRPCYKVVFDDGTTIIADADHRWLSHTYAARLGREQPQTLTTQEMSGTLRIHKSQRSNHAVRTSEAFDGTLFSLPIDPYVLGVWLGDGRANASSITTADHEVLSEIRQAGYEVHRQPSTKYGWCVTGLVTHLRQLNLFENKHIPDLYLFASKEQRLALLQGLMDSDGNANLNGSVEFTNTNQRLCNDVRKLALSLGHKVTMTEGRATLYGKDCGPKFRMKWTPKDIVFRLPRKAERQQLSTRRGTQEYRYVIDIVPVPSVPVKCLKVDSPSHLFLATEACIPTHNSDALLMGALQYVDTPGFAALLLRNTFADLSLPGSLMDRAHEWLDDQDGPRWLGSKNTWIFPAGATITFGYLDKPMDHLRYKGAEFQYIGFDEVTEIREKQYQYLFSRLRKPSNMSGLGLAKVPLRMRSASNPAPNWVRNRFVDPATNMDENGKRRLYVPSGVADNPFVDQRSYLEALAKLDPVERARLEKGDWWAEEEGSKFRREDFKLINPEDVPDMARIHQVRYWDIASTEKTNDNDPDWTAGALCSLVDGYLIIHDMRHTRTNPAGVERLVRQTAEEDGVHVKVRMESVGALGKMVIDHYARHVMLGFDFDGHPAIKGKEERMDPWAAMSRRGQVLLVKGPWCQAFMDEAVAYGALDVHDDQLDAVSGAFEVMTGIGQKKPPRIEIIL